MSPKAPEPTDNCGVWTIHCEIEDRPMLRGFAHTRQEADAQMAQLKAQDPAANFWLVELTHGSLQDFRDAAMLPPGF